MFRSDLFSEFDNRLPDEEVILFLEKMTLNSTPNLRLTLFETLTSPPKGKLIKTALRSLLFTDDNSADELC